MSCLSLGFPISKESYKSQTHNCCANQKILGYLIVKVRHGVTKDTSVDGDTQQYGVDEKHTF